MKRRPLIAGNWKMHHGPEEARRVAHAVVAGAAKVAAVDLVLCPPFVSLPAVAGVVGESAVALGAQNLHWETKGAFTGEVSGSMLVQTGCTFVIIGHSERRQLFGERDVEVARKLVSARAVGLTPIVCVGETLEEREAGRTWDVVSRQVRAATEGLAAAAVAETVFAYEPVWAIGTGRNATPEQAVEVHGKIRGWFDQRFGETVSGVVRILYGGSVKPGNAVALLSAEHIDGALVGGASLEAGSLLAIAAAAG